MARSISIIGLTGGIVALSSVTPAVAQERRFDIPAQSVATAVTAFGRQSGLQIVAPADLPADIHSTAVRGKLEVSTALRTMIAGTGLEIAADKGRTIVLRTVVDAPQPVTAADADAGQDIVVTATGRTQSLRQVPVSAAVVSGRQLQRDGITSMQDLAIRQPGFRISPSPASDYIAIRGVGSSANIGFEQSVGTFLDGVFRPRSRDTRLALFDLERVEILRGPQTTYFGNNTIAGALNLVSRKPGQTLAANGVLSYAPAFGEYVVEGGVDVPASDTLLFRISARQSGQDGYIRNAAGEKGPHLNDTVGRIGLSWKPTGGATLDARVDLGRMRDRAIFNIEALDCPPPAAFANAAGACARALAIGGGTVDNRLDRRSIANASRFDYDFGEGEVTAKVPTGLGTLSSITAYFKRKYDLLNDPVPFAGTLGGSAVGTTSALPIHLTERYEQFSEEVRLTSDADRPLSYILGAYYQRGNLDATLHTGQFFAAVAGATRGLLPATTPVASRVRVSEVASTYSGFAALTWRPVEPLRVNLAARYTRVDKDDARTTTIGTVGSVPGPDNFIPFSSSAQSLLYGSLGINPGDFADPRRRDGKLLPTASIQYDAGRTVMVYASYSEGFKAGGFSVGNAASSFRPERVKALEAGVKAELFDRRLSLNLAAFRSRYTDVQETTTVVEGAVFRQIVTNAAKSRADGVEANATLRPTERLTLTANLAYLRSRYDDYPNAPCTTLQQAARPTGCVQDLSGVTRAFAPRFSGNVGATYTLPLTDGLRATVAPLVYFSDRYFVVPIGDTRLLQPGFAKVDLRIGIGRERGWELALIGRNLTDKLTASYRQIVPGAAGTIGAMADAPRSIGLQLSFDLR